MTLVTKSQNVNLYQVGDIVQGEDNGYVPHTGLTDVQVATSITSLMPWMEHTALTTVVMISTRILFILTMSRADTRVRSTTFTMSLPHSASHCRT
jgi:hypothetical protein